MWSKDEADNLIYVFHARTDHLGLTGRDMFVRRVHFDIEDMPVMDMEPAEEVADETVELTVEVTEPAPLEVEATTRCVAGSAVLATTLTNPGDERSEERRVGKECGSRRRTHESRERGGKRDGAGKC